MLRTTMRTLIATLVALAVLASASGALDVSVGRPREHDGYLWVDLQLDDLFPPRVEQSLARGMPATLLLHVELWRRRNGWFDRLESTFESPLKIRYEVWSERYRVERVDAAGMALGSLDSVRSVLLRPLSLPVRRVAQLDPEARYYVAVSVTLKPLSVEDLEEGEGWLSGEVESKRRSGLGVITGLPRSVFDAVRNFAGFGDQNARALSEEFELSTLFRK